MALRILLADDSSDIRKSIAVSLQDYGAEVRAVTDGMDVLSVAREFRPDLILVDTVLPKKDGFTVCRELKTDSLLKAIPVILIYSGFVGIAKEKIAESKSNSTLEKPFESEQLRQLVNQFVSKTKNQKISEFLTFPSLGTIGNSSPQNLGLDQLDEEAEEFAEVAITTKPTRPLMPLPAASAPKISPTLPMTPPANHFEDSMNSFELEIPDDIQVNDLSGVEVIEAEDYDARPAPRRSSTPAYEPEEDDFEIGGLELEPEPPPQVPPPPIKPRSPLQSRIDQEKSKATQRPQASTSEPLSPKTPGSLMQLDPAHLEKILETHIQQAIESALWKVLPDIAERVIREEIERLMREVENET